MTKNKFLLVFITILFVCANIFSQTKSIEQVQTQINSFPNAEAFSVSYNDRKDITTLSLKLDLRGTDKALLKKFKELFLEMTSIYSGNLVDNKPVRNLLCINSRAKRFYFASNNDLLIQLDTETIKFVSPDRSTKVKGKKVREKLCWDIDKELIDDFSKANSISFQLNTFNKTLSEQVLLIFRNYRSISSVKAAS